MFLYLEVILSSVSADGATLYSKVVFLYYNKRGNGGKWVGCNQVAAELLSTEDLKVNNSHCICCLYWWFSQCERGLTAHPRNSNLTDLDQIKHQNFLKNLPR